MSTAINELTHGGREMIELALELMRSPLEEGKVRLAAAEFLTDRMAGKAPITIEAEATATMLGGRNIEELSDGALDAILAIVDGELGPDTVAELVDEPIAALPAAHEPTVAELERDAQEEIAERETASVLDSILTTGGDNGNS